MRRLVVHFGMAVAMLGSLGAHARSESSDSGVHPASSQAAAIDESAPLTLQKALELAAARSYAVSAAQRELEASDGEVGQAGALPNPELEASIEDTRRATRTTTSTLNFTLERGGKREARVAAAERARDVAQAGLRHAEAELRVSVVASFFGLLVAQERVELAAKSAETAGRAADAVARRVAAGKVSPVEETRARVEQANAELELTQAKGELRSARQSLAALWGNPDPVFTEAGGELDALPARPPADVLVRQLDGAPAVLASRLEVERRQALVGVERSKQSSDVVLSVGAKRDNELGRTQAIVGISVPLPLFDRNEGNVLAAARRVEKARAEYEAARIRTVNELQRASNQLEVAGVTAQALNTTVIPAAQQAYDAASRGFEAGKFGFLDVLDAQRTLLQARARYLETLASAYQAAANIDRILGR